ncbi:MAG: class I SAM-dependent methyltransferase [Bacteroidetes bacterium]|uniref:Class I SAM-dependent methyltransferase n=1 Tax=Candidatus Cryptobacteroides merdigallinarum TaxID=2840770 RepID=A0A9D9EIC0_9BACT|nr:class I SAM-dependent methyltransferase [Candidatus Cryptobacteroides merdigallinarum]
MADVQIPGTSPLVRHPEKEPLLPTATRAADIGCGTGRQTAVLASEPGVSVTAVDLLPEMVEGMKERMEYFDSVFPGMKSAAENVLVMQECGYVPVAHFVLPPSCWLFCPVWEQKTRAKKRKVLEIQEFQGLLEGCPVGFEPTTFRTTI